MASRKRSLSNNADMHALYKELDEASCAICMDHPHNAVLLLCGSHDKGCRSYICDTSYRHSNCLDRFRKLKDENTSPSLNLLNQNDIVNEPGADLRSSGDQNEAQGHHDVVNSATTGIVSDNSDSSLEDVRLEVNNSYISPDPLSNLRCPLCRGSVLGWKVVEEARRYLDLKSRCCSRESCLFVGNYRELRRHARRVHPAARPADVDPSRQRAWRRLEDQREYDDIVTAIRSAMPGAVVLGDYVIENGDRFAGERDRDRGQSDNSRWLSTFFWFQMIGSVDPGSEQRGGRSRALSRHRRSTEVFSRRRFLWGENLLGLQDDDDDDEDDDNDHENEPELNVLSDIGEDIVLNSRRRRRLTRSRSDEDRQ